MKIQESGENYLETILILQNQNGYVRSIDVANYMNFSKASVSRAMGILKEAGYLTMEPNGNLVLTEAGKKKADSVYERHTLIAKFLEMTLGVSSEIALQDSCRIEHVISDESFSRIKKYTQNSNSD
ncbi:metal-dependent transcriptional regulator [Caproiciproducens galactitolivorans]|uniref:Transcriptional regulator MntR n=1 Tax=Caproiciproducens galactitolivorans TaxID=642589 RepID=A0A4Z0YBA8_9FIRM|nr:metal-dependent transcriptional regulator [Caproiciproducens galactitolivorans]QEY33632.1 metal-dependent transcriptional regulator [Caproiciproducens galactitolivorans]TGJ76250.1 transcriptional regulator MntR [Caproiciproducens galactitolivorans]